MKNLQGTWEEFQEIFPKFFFGSSGFSAIFFVYVNGVTISSFFMSFGIFWFLWISLQSISDTKYFRFLQLQKLTREIQDMDSIKNWKERRNSILESDHDDNVLNLLIYLYNLLIILMLVIVYFSEGKHFLHSKEIN